MKTIRELAGEIGVSKQAIRNEIERQGLRSSLQETTKGLYLTEEQERQIVGAFEERQRQGFAYYPKTEKAENRKEYAGLQRIFEKELQDKNNTIERLQQQNADLIRQNADLIRHREERDRQNADTIAALTDTIKNLSDNLKAAQTLHHETIERIEDKETIIEPQQSDQPDPDQNETAADQDQGETDQDQSGEEPARNEQRANKEEEQPKRSFWRRLFG